MYFQRTFALSTLCLATVVVALLGSSYAMMGLIGTAALIAAAIGIFGGLLASDFTFTDLRVDVLKCLVVAYVLCGISYVLITKFGGFGAQVLPIFWLITMKLCWFELEKPALFLTFATSLLAPAFVVAVLLSVLQR